MDQTHLSGAGSILGPPWRCTAPQCGSYLKASCASPLGAPGYVCLLLPRCPAYLHLANSNRSFQILPQRPSTRKLENQGFRAGPARLSVSQQSQASLRVVQHIFLALVWLLVCLSCWRGCSEGSILPLLLDVFIDAGQVLSERVFEGMNEGTSGMI